MCEAVAYTWFDRLMALLFMGENGYTIPKVVTLDEGMSKPAILQNALSGQVEEHLKIDHKCLIELLNGRTAVADAQTEAYKMLLIAACNAWHGAMSFIFDLSKLCWYL